MDSCTIFSGIVLLFIFYILICISITILSDCDLLTFLYRFVGAKPGDAFSNKVIWITGGSSGIGEGIGKELAKACSSVKIVLSSRRAEELERVKRECLEINPKLSENSILALPFDMLDYSAHGPALQTVLQTFGKLDILVSNAGRSQRAKWEEIELSVDKQVFELNVFSLINLNRIVLCHFLSHGGGQLAVISSIAGKIGAPNSGSYTGSKFALHGYFESLRNESRGKNITITIICPGPVFSAVLKEAFTSKSGQKVDQEHGDRDRRMSPARCGVLSLVAIGNKLEEAWIAPAPIVFLTYSSAYLPFIFAQGNKLIHSTGLFAKLRDSRDVVQP